MKTLLLIMLLAVPAMAQNPDVPDAALALELRAGTTGTVLEDELSESRLLIAVIMPINDRFTVTAKVESRNFDMKDQEWKYESRTTYWEIGCRIYIGNSD